MEPFKIIECDWMPNDTVLLAPKRRDHETQEEYEKRCGIIRNLGASDKPAHQGTVLP